MKNKIKIIKKIRKITNISIEKCKEALELNKYNEEKSLIYLKKIKYIKNKKIPKEGIIINDIKKNKSIMIKINCETDFSSKNKEFINFSKKILNYCFKKNKIILKKIKNHFKKKKNYLISKLKENIIINNICMIKGKNIYKYLHNYKIGTILKYSMKKKNKKKIKKIAIHITAMNPKYISIKNIPRKNIKKEKKNISILEKNKNKISKILKKKIKKKILLKQQFIFNNKILVEDYIKKNNIKIKKFYRFEINK